MDDLVTWLRAQLDEDERAISGACVHIEDCNGSGYEDRFGGDRVLAEVEAKRRIIDRCLEGIAEDEWVRNLSPLAEGVILRLAQPYADRPGFKDEWRLT